MKRVLVIAAHPDDEVLGCGALIARHSEKGCEFHVLVLGEGTSCRYSDIEDPEILKEIDQRRHAFLAAMKILGVKESTVHNIKCGRFDQYPLIEVTKLIEKAIDSFKPDTVLTHSSTDTNRDHTITFEATLIATRPASKNFVRSVMSYEVMSSTECQFEKPFKPNIFEEVQLSHVEKKWSALKCYESEISPFPHPRSREVILGLAMTRGAQIGVLYAEAYSLVRERRS